MFLNQVVRLDVMNLYHVFHPLQEERLFEIFSQKILR